MGLVPYLAIILLNTLLVCVSCVAIVYPVLNQYRYCNNWLETCSQCQVHKFKNNKKLELL